MLARPAVIFCLEMVALRKRQEAEVEVADMKMLHWETAGWTGLGMSISEG